jgi:cobalamin biosynthesis protein CobT
MESNWRKSSYSGSNGGECVEVASAGAVLVRDTVDRHGPVLTFTADAWRAFTTTIK